MKSGQVRTPVIPFELTENGADAFGRRNQRTAELRDSFPSGRILHEQSYNAGDKNAYQNTAANLQDKQHAGNDDTCKGQKSGSLAQIPYRHQSG